MTNPIPLGTLLGALLASAGLWFGLWAIGSLLGIW